MTQLGHLGVRSTNRLEPKISDSGGNWPPSRADLIPIARRSNDGEGTVIDRQRGFLDGLLRNPIPYGGLSLFEVHVRNAVSVREVIGKANPVFRESSFPQGEA
jgi:hypothetical protein